MPESNNHSVLIDHLHSKYYPDMDKEKLSVVIMNDPDKFQAALKTIHKDNYSDQEFSDFNQAYVGKYGDPFSEKKSPDVSGQPVEMASQQPPSGATEEAEIIPVGGPGAQYEWGGPVTQQEAAAQETPFTTAEQQEIIQQADVETKERIEAEKQAARQADLEKQRERVTSTLDTYKSLQEGDVITPDVRYDDLKTIAATGAYTDKGQTFDEYAQERFPELSTDDRRVLRQMLKSERESEIIDSSRENVINRIQSGNLSVPEITVDLVSSAKEYFTPDQIKMADMLERRNAIISEMRNPAEETDMDALETDLENINGSLSAMREDTTDLFDPETGKLVARSEASEEDLAFEKAVQEETKRQAAIFSGTDAANFIQNMFDTKAKLAYYENEYRKFMTEKVLGRPEGSEPLSIDEINEEVAKYGPVQGLYGMPGVNPVMLKHQDERESIYRNMVDARRQFIAMSRAVLLNEDLTASKKRGFFRSAGEALVEAALPGDVDIETESDLRKAMIQAAGPGDLTEEQLKQAEDTFGEQAGQAVGTSIPIMAEIALTGGVVGAIGKAPAVASRLNKLQKVMTGAKASKIFGGAKNAEFAYNVMSSGVKGALTFAPTELTAEMGAAEGLTQGLLGEFGMDKFLSKSKWGKLAGLTLKTLAGASAETVAEFSGDYVQNLADSGFDTEDAFRETFGRDMDDFKDRLALTAMTSLMFSGTFNVAQARSMIKAMEPHKGNDAIDVATSTLEKAVADHESAPELTVTENGKPVEFNEKGEPIKPTEETTITPEPEVKEEQLITPEPSQEKTQEDAIQEQQTTEVPVGEQAGGGQEVSEAPVEAEQKIETKPEEKVDDIVDVLHGTHGKKNAEFLKSASEEDFVLPEGVDVSAEALYDSFDVVSENAEKGVRGKHLSKAIESGWKSLQKAGHDIALDDYKKIVTDAISANIFYDKKSDRPKTSTPFEKGSMTPEEVAKKSKESFQRSRSRVVSAVKARRAAKYIMDALKLSLTTKTANLRRAFIKSGSIGKEILAEKQKKREAGSSAELFWKERAEPVFKGLSQDERTAMEDVITLKRIISTDAMRDSKKEDRLKHPLLDKELGIRHNKESAEAALEGMRKDNPDLMKKVEKRADEYFKVFQDLLKMQLDSGRISQEVYNELSQWDYQPRKFLEKMLERESVFQMDDRGQYGVSNSDLKKLSEGDIDDLYMDSEWLLNAHVFTSHRKIRENKAAQKLADFVKKYKPEWARVKAHKDDKKSASEEELVYREDGVDKSIYMDPQFYKEWVGYQPLIGPKTSKVFRFVSGGALLRAFATGYNPAFAAANVFKDFGMALAVSSAYDGPVLALNALRLAKDLATVSKDAATRRGLFKDYMENGGSLNLLSRMGRPTSGVTRTGKIIKGATKSAQKLGDILGYIGETSEIMTRLAIYSRSLKNQMESEGVSEPTERMKAIAAYEAVNFIDFGEGGQVTKMLDTAAPYLNAAMQGFRVTTNYIKDNPKQFMNKAMQAGVGAALIAMYNMLSYEDDWEEVPTWVKNKNFVFMTPWVDDEGERYYISIPKPEGIGSILNAFELSSEVMYKKIKGKPIDKEKFDDRYYDSVEAMFPVEPGKLASRIPLLSSYLAYAHNHDLYKEKPVMDQEDFIDTFGPEQTDANVEAFYDQIAKFFGEYDEESKSYKDGPSPKRMKAATEKFITNPSNNPLVAVMYEGLDAMLVDDEANKIHKRNVGKNFTDKMFGRFIKKTNPGWDDFGELPDEVKGIKTQTNRVNRKLSDYADQFKNDGVVKSKSDVPKEVIDYIESEYDNELDQAKAIKKYALKTKYKANPIKHFDIVLEKNPKAQATLFANEFGFLPEKELKEQVRKVFVDRKPPKQFYYYYNELVSGAKVKDETVSKKEFIDDAKPSTNN